MSIGWIKLHRSLIDWEWWDDHNATRLLIYLLCTVNYEPKRWKGIEVNAGGLITSFPKLAERTGMSVKQVRVAMDKLESSGEVAREKAREGQLITLRKWDKLQSKEFERADGTAGKKSEDGQADGTKGAPTKEGNNSITEETKRKGFSPPTPTQVSEYAKEWKGIETDGEKFCDFYESKGWKVGKTKMVSWKASVRNWFKEDATKKQEEKKAAETKYVHPNLLPPIVD